MRSKQLQLDRYDTDKIINRYMEEYDQVLEPWVQKEIRLLELGINKGGSLLLWRDYFQKATIVGIDLKLPKDFTPGERLYLFQGSQTDSLFLSDVAKKTALDGFDIIIDDASHIGEFTKRSFWHLFDNHLKPGGLYAIEDWGAGYLDDFPDGKSIDIDRVFRSKFRTRLLTRFSFIMNKYYAKLKEYPQKIQNILLIPFNFLLKVPYRTHSYGIVGFVKQLIDEQGASNVTKARLTGKPVRQSKFADMLITQNIVFIRKATNQP